jgi:hypothetical protein
MGVVLSNPAMSAMVAHAVTASYADQLKSW